MRVMVIMKSTAESEAGAMHGKEDMEKMIAFHEVMVKAGVLKDADGLKPSKFGKRVRFRRNGKPSITDGPFAETKELIAGYWVLEVKSMDEALEWVKRFPHPTLGEEADLEIRPFWEAEDFGGEFTPEMQERIDEMHRTVTPKA
jgi:hypothetical protein